MIAAIKAIGDEMTERGWDKNGAAGSVKRDAEGKIVAQHDSAECMRDFDDARDAIAAREPWRN
ncbi:UNVERIFIED_ORG: hypothetical protein J2W74_003427 [Methylorubrum zatmanii]